MNDHHLDDLIIGDPEPGSNKPKALLTLIALAVVVLVIVLVLWSLIGGSGSSDSASQQNTQEQASKPLAPDLIPLDGSDKEAKQPSSKAETKPSSTLKPVQIDKPKETTPQPKPASQETVTKTEPVKKPTPKPAVEKPIKPKAETQKPSTGTQQSTTKPQVIENANKTIYYIQVGAFKRDPNKKFIQKLKDNGFTFITKTSKNIRRVRVGPYDSYQQAKDALPEIKAKLGIDGLIVKY